MNEKSYRRNITGLVQEHWRERLLIRPARSYPVSDHHNGRNFHNLERNPRDRKELLSWLLTRQPAPWPRWVENEIYPLPPAQLSENMADWCVTFINHATVLLQMGEWNILTDPVWSERVSPFLRLGPRRVRAPGIALADLPPIHMVLLSHNHYDHMDLAALRVLNKKDQPLVVTGLGNAALLHANGLNRVKELDWWQSVRFEHFDIHFTPAQHFSGRSLRDRNQTLWGSFWVNTPDGNFYFAGDTGYGKHFTLTNQRLGDVRLALLPIGAYQPRTALGPVHMNPEEAVLAHRDLKAHYSLGIHFNTFQLTDEAMGQPVIDLAAARDRHEIDADKFRVLCEGEGWQVDG